MSAGTGWIRRATAAAATMALALVGTAGLGTGGVTAAPAGGPPAVTVTGLAAPAPQAVSDAELAAVAGMRVLFGHQSVGWNVISGVEQLYQRAGVSPPRIEEVYDSVPGGSGGLLAHAAIGSNGDPSSKVAAFADLVRANAGRIQAALMKFCYVDVTAGTDVAAVFDEYSRTMDALQRQFPDLTLLHVTVPLTTDSAADNAARQRYNQLLRQRYGSTGHLVDLAAAESTTPAGSRVSGRYRGTRYFAMWPGYTDDGGHLNARGSRKVAGVLLDRLAAVG